MTQGQATVICRLCGGRAVNDTGWEICADCYGHGIDGRYFQWVVSRLDDPKVQGDERRELARAHLLVSGMPYGAGDHLARRVAR